MRTILSVGSQSSAVVLQREAISDPEEQVSDMNTPSGFKLSPAQTIIGGMEFFSGWCQIGVGQVPVN